MAMLLEGEVMPDSSEGRERITRLEERVDENRHQIRALGSLPLAMELTRRDLSELKEDMQKFEARMEARFDRDLGSVQERVSACADEIGKLRREDREDRTQTTSSRRAMWGLLGAAAVSGVFALLIQVIQTLGG